MFGCSHTRVLEPHQFDFSCEWNNEWIECMHLQAQPHCMSPMVVFKYKAAPVSVNGSTILETEQEEGSDQDDEQGKAISSFRATQQANWPTELCVAALSTFYIVLSSKNIELIWRQRNQNCAGYSTRYFTCIFKFQSKFTNLMHCKNKCSVWEPKLYVSKLLTSIRLWW